MSPDFFHDAIQPSLFAVEDRFDRDTLTPVSAPPTASPSLLRLPLTLRFTVDGKPAPQGSKRVVGGRMGKSGKITAPHAIEANKRTRPWRAVVRDAAARAIEAGDWQTFREAPISVDITFYKPRPKYHYFTGKRADVARPDAAVYCTTGPDIDKMSRAVLDSMTDAKVYFDDNQVADLRAVHLYCGRDGDFPNGGISVTVRVLSNLNPTL